MIDDIKLYGSYVDGGKQDKLLHSANIKVLQVVNSNIRYKSVYKWELKTNVELREQCIIGLRTPMRDAGANAKPTRIISLMLAGSEFQSLGRAIVKEDEYEEGKCRGVLQRRFYCDSKSVVLYEQPMIIFGNYKQHPIRDCVLL
ncbi:hypothetical protein ANN_16312 [Periplaneta americana]|uniref:Uncharacterized protein n=1 Tax=Periplaneta americana TaxID=6978 RepID=A0ABQ8SIL7_PERAM|nr:hypothetical protein ANN_16312 [Periplaneta americana]